MEVGSMVEVDTLDRMSTWVVAFAEAVVSVAVAIVEVSLVVVWDIVADMALDTLVGMEVDTTYISS